MTTCQEALLHEHDEQRCFRKYGSLTSWIKAEVCSYEIKKYLLSGLYT